MVQGEVKIRPAEATDITAIADLIEKIELFYGSSSIQERGQRITQVTQALFGNPPLASALVVVTESGDIVGLAAYSYLWPAAGSSHSLFLKELYISDEFRKQGIGKRIMQELHSVALQRPGCSRIEWTTDKDNTGARSFYRDLGFEEYDGKIFFRQSIEQ